jgi:DNA-binding MarR family transcriptional regulator
VAIQSAPSPTDTDTLAAALERRIAQLTRLLRANAHSTRSVAALLTLRRLDERGPMRVTDLAAAELVAQPTMTGLVRRLEQDGLVRRTPDAGDARAVLVELTGAGRDQLAAVRQARAEVLRLRLDRLDDDARAALTGALPALEALLTSENE